MPSLAGPPAPSFNRGSGAPHQTARQPVARPVVEREDIIYGRNPVVEAIRAGRPLNRVLMASGMRDAASSNVKVLAREAGVLLEEAPRERLDQVTSGNHQGFVAFTAPKAYVSMEEMVRGVFSRGEVPLILVLDEVEDPHNLGAILRSADAAGAHGVVIPQRRAVGLTETVAKSSAGAIEHVPVAREVNLSRAVEQLKALGLWVVALDMNENTLHFAANLTGPLAIVIGGEGKGVGRLLREKCDFAISIPMKGKVSSLNASAAASVVLYEVVRQRCALLV